MFSRSLFVLLYVFFWPLCCLFFFDIRILITSLVSSNSSYLYLMLYNVISEWDLLDKWDESNTHIFRGKDNTTLNIYTDETTCLTHIVLCCVLFLRLVYPMFPVSLDCPFLIATSVFSTVYLHQFPVNNSLFEMIVYDFLQSSISFFLVVWRSRFLTPSNLGNTLWWKIEYSDKNPNLPQFPDVSGITLIM